MKRHVFFLLTLIYICIAFPHVTIAIDEEKLSPITLKTREIVEAAHAYILVHSDDMAAVQHALQTNPAFFDHEKNLYIFVHYYNIEKKEAICCGQGVRPELIGKNMWHLRTPNGRLLFYEIASMIEKDGEGWIEYDWLNPFTKTLQTKVSFAKGIVLKDGRKAWVGSGYWKNFGQKDF